MEITEVRIRPVRSKGRVLAFASITIDHCFAVHNLKVIEGRDGSFVAMPCRRLIDGSHKDIAHPVNNATRKAIEDKILQEYDRTVKMMGEGPSKQEPVHTENRSDEEQRKARIDFVTEDVPFDDDDDDDDSFWATL